jgi:hypothetical protein
MSSRMSWGISGLSFELGGMFEPVVVCKVGACSL